MSHVQFSAELNFNIAVSLGSVTGIRRFAVPGSRAALAADTFTDVSTLAGETIPLPDNTGQALQVWSTSAADTQQIRVSGLGANGVPIADQVITLNGTTPVNIPVNMSRINDARNIDTSPIVGTVNVGVSPATIFCNILPENQRSKQCIISIPQNSSIVVPSIIASLKRSGNLSQDFSVSIFPQTKDFDQTYWYRDIDFELVKNGNSSAQFADIFPAELVGPADMKVSAVSSLVNAEVTTRLNGIIVERQPMAV